MRWPAEYEAQRATWMSWPGNPTTWRECRKELEEEYARFAACVSRLQPLNLVCPSPWQEQAEAQLAAQDADLNEICFHDWSLNDAWARDHMPLFLDDGSVVDLPYNAWGAKYHPWQDDDAIAEQVARHRDRKHSRFPFIGEGGALEINSRGELLCTESVWLNPNRNPQVSKAAIEQAFAEQLGVTRTIWLEKGLSGDDTDGHIDTLSRFVSDEVVVTALPHKGHPEYPQLRANADRLREHVDVIGLPLPEPRLLGGRLAPASYANFLILNDAVLVPSYGQWDWDQLALGILNDVFPTRDVVGLDCQAILQEGGALHCLAMQECLASGEENTE